LCASKTIFLLCHINKASANMADSAAYIELASNATDYFPEAVLDDVMIHPLYPTQKILIGTSNGSTPGLTITSNYIGIFDATPSYTLDVNGTTRITGNVANTPDMTVGNMLVKTYNKSLTTTALDYTNICTISATNGASAFQLNVVHSQGSSGESKTYMVNVSYAGDGNYYRLNPISSSGVFGGQDWSVEINRNGAVSTLRLVRISGTVSSVNFTCTLQVYQSQSNPVTITDSTTTGSTASNNGLWESTQITQVDGNVGIGTEAPGEKMDITGNVKCSNMYATSFVGIGTSNPKQLLTVNLTELGSGRVLINGSGTTPFTLTPLTTKRASFAITAGETVVANNPAQITLIRTMASNVGAYPSLFEFATCDTSSSNINGNLYGGVGSNRELGQIRWNADDYVDMRTTGALIGAITTSNTSNGIVPTSIYFKTTAPSSALAEVMRITDIGNVGINTTTPAYKLDVTGDIHSTSNSSFNNALVGAIGYTGFAGLQNSNLTISAGNYAILQSSTGQTLLNASTGQTINFRNNNVDQGAWTANGLGIGTITPSFNLHVSSNTSTVIVATENTNSANWSGFAARNNASGAAGGMRMGMFGTTWSSFSQYLQNGGFIECDGSNGISISATSNTGEIRWYTGGTTERMRLSSGGNLGIGLTNPAYKLDVNGAINSTSIQGPTITALSNLGLFGSNTSVSASNVSIALSNYVYGANTTTIATAQTTANWSSNAAVYGSNNAVWSSNNLLKKSGDTMNGLLTLNSSMLMNTNDNTYIGVNAGNAAPCLGIVKKFGFQPHFAFTSNNTNNTFANSMSFGMLSGSNLGAVADCNLTTMMTLTNAGNVGINTTIPAYKLDVNGNTRLNNAVIGDIIGNIAWAGIAHSNNVNSTNYALLNSSSGTTILNSTSGFPIYFSHNNSTQMTLTSGNLGIGTTSPSYKLDVSGTFRSTGNGIINTTLVGDVGYSTWAGLQHSSLAAGAGNYAILQSSSGQTLINASTGQLILFRNNNGDIGAWSTTGLGVGTTSPSYKLDVSGTIRGNQLIVGTTGTSNAIYFGGVTGDATNCTFIMERLYDPTNDSNVASDYSELLFAKYNDTSTGAGPDRIRHLAAAHKWQVYSSVTSGDTNINLADSNFLTAMYIDSNANVGIGLSNLTTTTYKLDVNGVIRSRGNGVIYTALLGDCGYGAAFAGLQHSNLSTGVGSYGFGQTSTGLTAVNASAGQYIAFRNNNTDQGAWTTTGLGVGTSSPSYKLDVIHATSASAIIRVCDTGAAYGRLVFGNTNHGIGRGVNISTATDGNDVVVHTAGNGSVALCTSYGEGFRVNSSGNVGIGTASPSYKLDVNGTARVTNILYMNDQVQNCVIDLFGASPATTKTDYFGFGINASILRYQVDGTGSDHVIFANTTELMRIKGTGNVGIGTNSPSYKLHVSGTIYSSSDIIAFSDRRLKSNINIIDSALTKIHKMSGYTFNVEQDDKLHTGLIAQEVVEVLPEAVYQEKKQDGTDGYYSVAYGNMAGLFVEAIKEIDNKYSKVISDLQSQLTKLQNEIIAMKN
jgi:Chaperone of endosialidase